MTQSSFPRRILMFGLLAAVILVAAGLGNGMGRTTAAQSTPADATPITVEVPVLAYYYIWFDTQSWDRAKTDYPIARPLLERRRGGHAPAHPVGEGTPASTASSSAGRAPTSSTARLKRLVPIAEEEDFKLAIIYQGLDFDRQPLPIDKSRRRPGLLSHAVRRRARRSIFSASRS